jgi:hypothetical protein
MLFLAALTVAGLSTPDASAFGHLGRSNVSVSSGRAFGLFGGRQNVNVSVVNGRGGVVGVNRGFGVNRTFVGNGFSFSRSFGYGSFGRSYGVGIGYGSYGATYGVGASYGATYAAAAAYADPAPPVAAPTVRYDPPVALPYTAPPPVTFAVAPAVTYVLPAVAYYALPAVSYSYAPAVGFSYGGGYRGVAGCH